MNRKTLSATFLKYVSMNVAGMIALSCYILADTFFIANGLGPDGLTALNLAIPVYSFIHGTGLMIGMGGGTMFSIHWARDDRSAAAASFTAALRLGALAALLFLLIGIFACGPLTRLLGADASVFPMTQIYLRILCFFSPAFILNNIILCFVRNDGEPQLSMAAMITGSFSNILLDYIFIFPCGLGMAGAAVATGFAPLISLGILSLHFLRKRSSLALGRIPLWTGNYGRILSLGLSSLIAEAASGIVIIVFNLIILSLSGNTGVAAYGIIANLSLVVTAVFTGIAQGMQPLLSRSHGSGRTDETAFLWRLGIALSTLLSLVIYLLIYVFHREIIAVFNSTGDETLFEIARSGMLLYFTGFLFAGVNLITAALYSSTGRPLPSFLLSFCRGFAIILPCVLILSRLVGMTGVWLAYPAAEILTLGTGNFTKFPVPNVSKKEES